LTVFRSWQVSSPAVVTSQSLVARTFRKQCAPTENHQPGDSSKIMHLFHKRSFYSVAFLGKRCRAEKNKTAPTKGHKTHPAFASGTVEIRGSSLSPLPPLSPLSDFSPLSAFSFLSHWMSLAWASTGRIKLTATIAKILRSRRNSS
jgi:hypothetical protein